MLCNVPRGSPVETTGDNCGDSNEWLNWLGWGGAGTRRAWLLRCSELSEWINHVLTSPTFDTYDTCSLILILTFCAELCCAVLALGYLDILDKKGLTLHIINFAGLRPAVY